MKVNQSSSLIPFLFYFVFFLIGLININSPFVNAQHERQNQTVSIAQNVAKFGLTGIFFPRADFSNPVSPESKYTVIHWEFPFLGVFYLPFAFIGIQEFWIFRIIMILISIIAGHCAFKTFLFLTDNKAFSEILLSLFLFSPFVLHFGQVPMPDMITTCFLVISFYSALKFQQKQNNFYLFQASLFFGLSLIAKASIIPFGLPILGMFWSKNKLMSKNIQISFLWGLLPSLFLISWALLSLESPEGSWNLLQARKDQLDIVLDLLSFNYYFRIICYISLFGIGFVGLFFTFKGIKAILESNKSAALLFNILISMVFTYIVLHTKMWREPQYSVPILFWLLILASFSITSFEIIWRKNRKYIITGMLVQLIISGYLTIDLKADRMPHIEQLEKVSKEIPVDARVLQLSRSYGGTICLYLKQHNLAKIEDAADPGQFLSEYKKYGYQYLLFFDYSLRKDLFSSKREWVYATETHKNVYDYARKNLILVKSDSNLKLFKF